MQWGTMATVLEWLFYIQGWGCLSTSLSCSLQLKDKVYFQGFSVFFFRLGTHPNSGAKGPRKNKKWSLA